MRHHRHGGRKQTQRSSHHQKLYSHSADLLDSRGIIPSAVESKPLRNDAELLFTDSQSQVSGLRDQVLFAASAVLVGRNPTRMTAGKTTLSRGSRRCVL